MMKTQGAGDLLRLFFFLMTSQVLDMTGCVQDLDYLALWLPTFQTLLVNDGVGSLGYCLLQGIAAHLIQPAGSQSSLLFVGAKRLNQRVNLQRRFILRHKQQTCSYSSQSCSFSKSRRSWKPCLCMSEQRPGPLQSLMSLLLIKHSRQNLSDLVVRESHW